MLNREDKASAGHERAMHFRQESMQVLDVVKSERAIREVEGVCRQLKMFHVRLGVRDRCVVSLAARTLQHLLGDIDALDSRRPVLLREAAEPAESATEVKDVESSYIGKHRA